MNKLKFLIVFMIYFFSISLAAFSQTNTKANVSLTTLSDMELISKFGSEEKIDKTPIAIEIFSRGEKMIPFLMNLKGNRLIYDGYCLGDPNGADSISLIPVVEGSVVYIEVAALYLINAIYFNNLHFANVPYLSDKKQDKVTGLKSNDYNSSKRLKKAWDSTEKWFKKVQKEGLEKLKVSNEFPLKANNLYFIGTSPKRKRDFPACKK
jgi:hypothetical protein